MPVCDDGRVRVVNMVGVHVGGTTNACVTVSVERVVTNRIGTSSSLSWCGGIITATRVACHV